MLLRNFAGSGHSKVPQLLARHGRDAGKGCALCGCVLVCARAPAGDNATHRPICFTGTGTALINHAIRGRSSLQAYQILWVLCAQSLHAPLPPEHGWSSWICLAFLGTVSWIRTMVMHVQVIAANAAAGYGAAAVTAAITTPLDVAKTRMQTAPQKLGMGAAFKSIMSEGGVRALYTGAGPRSARAGCAYAILMSSYEAFKGMGLTVSTASAEEQ